MSTIINGLLLLSELASPAGEGQWTREIQNVSWEEVYTANFLIKEKTLHVELAPCADKRDSQCIFQSWRVWVGYALDGLPAQKSPVLLGQPHCTLSFDPYQRSYDTFNLECAGVKRTIFYTNLPASLKKHFP